MYRANMGKAFVGPDCPRWVDELLSPESLRKTGYFDRSAVELACEAQLRKPLKSLYRFSMDMGVMGVIATQLWQHMYCGGGLCELPTWTPPDLTQTRLCGRLEAPAPSEGQTPTIAC